MIDAESVLKVFTVLMGAWASGYGFGKSVAWVRFIRTAA